MFELDLYGLILPFSYITVLLASLISFSSIYRKRKAAKAASLAPWFPPNVPRDIYLSLLHLEPEPGKEKPPAVPESVIRAALMRRAVEDIQRLVTLRTAKAACNALLQQGKVGDDLWQRFLRAEKEQDYEVRDVVQEAESLAPNWGTYIFQSANEMAARMHFQKRLDEIESKTKAEKQWWEKRKATIQSDFMKELDADASASSKAPATKTGSDEDSVLVETPSNMDKGSIKRKKGKK